MKIIREMVFILAVMFILTGCNDNRLDNIKNQESKFPADLAGTWRTDDGLWLMSFNPDGSLYSIKYYFNRHPMVISRGGGYDIFEDGSLRSAYIFGEHSSHYDPKSAELSVEIAIDNFEITRPMGKFEGHMIDKFSGKISDDKKTWTAVWNNRTTVKGIEGESITTQELVFRHIEKTELEESH